MMYINGMYHTRRIKMEIAKVFQTGRSQAVRLPKAFRFCVIHRHHFNIIGVYEQRNSTKTRMG